MNPSVKTFLWFCLPALLVAAGLRLALTWEMPHAVMLPDSKDYLATVSGYLKDGKINIHEKKTFLTPYLYAVPFLFRIPALAAITVFQHALGIGIVAISGVLCRLWFARWKWFVVPVTMLVAVNPCLLWYEQVVMGETVFAFCVMLMLLGATYFGQRHSWMSYGLFLLGVFAASAARPEGKLFLGFGLLLTILVFWRKWRESAIALGVFLVFTAGTLKLTSTAQPGLLLLTSVVHWTPEKLWSAPGLADLLRPIGDDVNRRWREEHGFAEARHRKEVAETVRRYLQAQGRKGSKSEVAKLAKKVGLEISFRNLHRSPELVFLKYKKNAQTLVSGDFDRYELVEKQRNAYSDSPDMAGLLSKGLTGRQRSVAEMQKFVEARYHPDRLEWFRQWARIWEATVLSWATPTHLFRDRYMDGGIPYLQILAMVGIISAALRFDRLEALHFSWFWGLVFFGFVLILTAPPKSRFTFVLEPFWTFYPLFLIDTCTRWRRARAFRRENHAPGVA